MPAPARKRRPVRTHHVASHDRAGRARAPTSGELGLEVVDEAIERGLIVAHFGVAVEVLLDASGERRPVKVLRRSGHVVGDRVELIGERLTRLERRNELRRRDSMGRAHVVAANLDVLGIVVAPRPATPAGFVDRALVAAAAAGLEPVIVLNKADLPEAEALAAELRATWPASASGEPLRICVVSAAVSAAHASGLAELRSILAGPPGLRGVFVGTSGVGKSSLVNALLPALALAVGEINQFSGLGRHTTTTATLHALPEGGELVDTPGFREFGLVEITARELATWFPGFVAIHAHQHCRFADCLHLAEPDCAIKLARERGELADARWQAYRDLAEALRTGGG
ncbi:ribosome small subunit-dependent GTPase A [Nannocystaceae bacterium ST9]